ncbi:MAG: GTP-binding protein [Phycisphaerae bacterium]|nr:GTP-binding protein [Phycisphaerae bacterium]NIP52389.1 GTP-binding protein [Phycisphaerae bacterium]NIS51385.1 GTP-binding protein [Phycisphaerae bacterium]NIU09000.1 GTP-binding protein [Phycisphaerae bacterium]NIU56660.1 GTP-binding protein [Phycisphaerae bacterium]
MYELDDTIVAISSPEAGQRVIIRISGSETINICERIFSTPIPKEQGGVFPGRIAVDSELQIDATLYLFLAPHSYTGDDIAEIHIHTNASVTEALMGNLLSSGGQIRMAGPGEFTARAYLNGKMDLTQAEAVNEVVVSSNKLQLAASEKLLAGRLGQTTSKIRSELMDCLSLIEAGLDFSGEDIEFITRPEAVERLTQINNELEGLLSGSVRYEEVVDLPAVGIAGAPNAGKSSLLNRLLGQERSIVSELHKTTRDVLTGTLTLTHCKCVLFDCAGLITESHEILDELAQQAAIEALRNSSVVVFCVDITKTDWNKDISIRTLIEPESLIPAATKSDLLSEKLVAKRLCVLHEVFGVEFLPISVETGRGIELLRETIDKTIIDLTVGAGSSGQVLEQISTVALTTRHKQAITEAIENVSEAISELKGGNDEVAAMMLRAARQGLFDIESATGGVERTDEQILERIFGRFCIGK